MAIEEKMKFLDSKKKFIIEIKKMKLINTNKNIKNQLICQKFN